MACRIGISLFATLGLFAGVGYRLANQAPAGAAEIAERRCIDDVANYAGDEDQGDAIEAQVAACGGANA